MLGILLGALAFYALLWVGHSVPTDRGAWRHPPRLAQLIFRRGQGDLDVVKVVGEVWFLSCFLAACVGLVLPSQAAGPLVAVVGVAGALAVFATGLVVRLRA